MTLTVHNYESRLSYIGIQTMLQMCWVGVGRNHWYHAIFIGKGKIFQDKKVLLLEGGPQVKLDKVPKLYSNRVSTITAGSRDLLESM